MQGKVYRNLKLLQHFGYYQTVEDRGNYTYIKSRFDDPWYNFIVPSIEASEFDLLETEKIIAEEYKQGYKFSYYIDDASKTEYEQKLSSVGYRKMGTDVYLYLKQDNKFELDESVFEEVTKDNLKKFLNLVEVCFPDWDNNKEYASYCFELESKEPGDIIKNYMIKENGNYVSFGSILGSQNQSMSYLHNMGTHPKYRRTGLFTKFSKFLINKSVEANIHEVSTIVEAGGGSYFGFKKLGFTRHETYNLYSKN
jgi:hypothetical protein